MIGRRKIGEKDQEDEMDRVNSLARFVKRMLNFFPLFVFDYLD